MLNHVEVRKKGEKKSTQSPKWPSFMDILCIDQLMFYSDLMVEQLGNKKESLP